MTLGDGINASCKPRNTGTGSCAARFEFRSEAGLIAMCMKGKWTFRVASSKDREPALNDAAVAWAVPVSPFWAEGRPGVRVFRTPYGQTGRVTMRYETKDFCIGFFTLLTNTDNPAEMENLAKGTPATAENLTIFFEGSGTWVARMTSAQFQAFIDDVSDINLYRCLFECVPAEWHNTDSAYRLWGTKLFRPFGKQQFITPFAPSTTGEGREGAQRCFGFLQAMIDLQAWWPKSSPTGIYQRDIEDLLEGQTPGRWKQLKEQAHGT